MSAERPGEFDITFKVYPNGRASGFLNKLKIGDKVNVFRMGNKRRQPAGFVGVVAYGVGITEALPVVMAELQKTDAKQVGLIWAAQTRGDTFWHTQIEALLQSYKGRFEFSMILSREKQQGALHGRVTPGVLNEVFVDRWSADEEFDRRQTRFLSVGTKEMMHHTDASLECIGFPMPRHALLCY